MFTGLAERFGDEAPRIMDVGDQVDGAEDRAKITRNNVSEEAICSSSDTFGTQATVVGECGTGRGEARAGAGSGSLQ